MQREQALLGASLKYRAYKEDSEDVCPARTSRAAAQQDSEIMRWLYGGRWYVREEPDNA